MHQHILIPCKLFLFLICLAVSGSCDTAIDDIPNPEEPTDLTPAITHISPSSGPKNTVVTITGVNLNTDDNLTVYFNNKEAEVHVVSDKEITAIVPAGAFSGMVKVIIHGEILNGTDFEYVISEVKVNTLAGTTSGYLDGPIDEAQFYFPYGVEIDASGNVYVADTYNYKIRKIDLSGVVSTVAGSTFGFADGMGSAARFSNPIGIAVDASGTLYVADAPNHKIRKITPSGDVSTFAGGTGGFADGLGPDAKFANPWGVAVDNAGMVYVADYDNHKIRRITPEGEVTTIADSALYNPTGVAVDTSGNVYVADNGSHKVRKILTSGKMITLAGSTSGYADGIGEMAQFVHPRDIAVDAYGNVYVTDNQKIRKINPSGVVTTLAGSTTGYADGNGQDALFNNPYGIAVDASGILYVVEYTNQKIRIITQD